jgi:hypothetical protein
MKKLLLAALLNTMCVGLALVASAGQVKAQTTVVVVAPPVDSYSATIVQLEVALALAKNRPTIESVVIWTKCGHYTSIYVKYTNGVKTSKQFTDKAPINEAQLAAMVATGKVNVIDEDFGVPQCPSE